MVNQVQLSKRNTNAYGVISEKLVVLIKRLIPLFIIFYGATASFAVAQCLFNVAGTANSTLANDGLILARVGREQRGAVLISRVATSQTPDALVAQIAANEQRLDVNGSGAFDHDDATIIARHLAGFRDGGLIVGGAGIGATRKTGAAIQDYLDGGCVAAPAARKKLSVMKAEQMAQNNGGVFISVLDDVEIDQSVELTWLEIQGRLVCTDQNLSLSSRWIVVHGGILQCGTSLNPFTKKLTLTLVGAKSDEVALGASMGTKLLGAMHGGRIHLYGENRVNWTQLAQSAAVGATQITLKEPVDWRVGEKLVVAASTLDPGQTEERMIASVSPDRTTLTLTEALNHFHYAQLQTFASRTLDSRAEVGLLTRNIVIQGDDLSQGEQFGGHVMIMGGSSTVRETDAIKRSSARIQGVEFWRMGQFDRLGRYPIHWHLNGDSSGDFVRGSSFHSNFQRGVVVHGTDNTAIERNIVHRSIGHSYSSEDGSETGNQFVMNLGLQTLPFPRAASNPAQASQNDTQAATFWIRGANNRFIGNHAAGGENSAFWFDNVGLVDQSKFEFRGNLAHSYLIDGNRNGDMCCGGFEKSALWFTGDGYDKPYRGPFPISEMTIYKTRTAMWGNPRTVGQGFADVRLSESIIADNLMGINSHGAKDTVIVGRSANPDTVGQLGSQGVQEYGHSLRLENVTFVNFPGGGALAHRNCHREAGNVTAINTRFVNSKINLCASSTQQTNDMAISDTTGSLLANAVPVTITPANNASRAMYIANDCPINASLGARVCNGLLRYSNLHMRGASANLLRDDGVTLNQADVDTYPFYWTTIEGRRYAFTGDVASQPAIEFTMFGKYEDDDADRSTIVRIPATSNFSIVGLNANWFSQWNDTRNGMTAVARLASLAALEASATTAYFFDATTRSVHLKIWTNGVNRVYIDRR
jgi:G8 domain